MRKDNLSVKLSYFLIGSAVGSIATFLFGTHTGRVFRRILRNDTNLLWENASERGKGLIISVEENIHHYYNRAVRNIEREVRSIRAGVDSALNFLQYSSIDNDFIDVDKGLLIEENDFSFEDEYLPKREGMGHRRNYKKSN